MLGLALAATRIWALPHKASTLGKPGRADLRIPGLLQRIALCHLLAAAVLVGTGQDAGGRLGLWPGRVVGVAAGVPVGYRAVLMAVPGFGVGQLDADGYLGASIDRAVFTPPHLWPLGWAHPGGPVVYDPEGLPSTVPATVNSLFGALVG